MRKYIFPFLSVFLLGLAVVINAESTLPTTLDSARNQWVQAYNSASLEIARLYIDDAALFTGEKLISGNKMVAKFLKSRYKTVATITERKITETFEHDIFRFYEIGYYQTDHPELKQLLYLTAWQKSAEWQRVLDIILSAGTAEVDREGIGKANQAFMEWVAKHDPAGLIKNLYTESGIHLHRGRVYQGYPALTDRFQHIADPAYQFSMETKQLFPAGPGMVVQVCYYQGRFQKYSQGLLFFVWEKQADGSWKIVMDHNF